LEEDRAGDGDRAGAAEEAAEDAEEARCVAELHLLAVQHGIDLPAPGPREAVPGPEREDEPDEEDGCEQGGFHHTYSVIWSMNSLTPSRRSMNSRKAVRESSTASFGAFRPVSSSVRTSTPKRLPTRMQPAVSSSVLPMWKRMRERLGT